MITSNWLPRVFEFGLNVWKMSENVDMVTLYNLYVVGVRVKSSGSDSVSGYQRPTEGGQAVRRGGRDSVAKGELAQEVFAATSMRPHIFL